MPVCPNLRHCADNEADYTDEALRKTTPWNVRDLRDDRFHGERFYETDEQPRWLVKRRGASPVGRSQQVT